MGGIFGKTTSTSDPVPITELKINRSTYGVVIPAVYGRARIAGNYLWAGDFQSHKQQKGGKGGPSGSVFYTYSMSQMVAYSYGPIQGYGRAWINSSTGLKRSRVGTGSGRYTALGNFGQAPWPYLVSKHPAFAIGYSGLAWHGRANFDLGTSTVPPPSSVEVFGITAGGTSPNGDAYVDLTIRDVIANSFYGAVPGATWVDSFTDFRNYCVANGLFLSLVTDTQKPASDWIKDLLEITNSDGYFSNGLFKIASMGDTQVTGNGVTWTPNTTAIYSFTDDDLIAGSNEDPLIIEQPNPADRYNVVQVEYLNAANDYNTQIVEVKDEAQIQVHGRRGDSPKSFHPITSALVAQFVARVQLQRRLFVINKYTFTVSGRYFLLDPMDIVGVTDASMGLNVYPVRITDIEEDEKHELKITAEDLGPNFTPAYPTQPIGSWIHADGDTLPQSVNDPIFIEPGLLVPAETPELWIALSGQNAGGQVGAMDWGGCNVWYSEDNTTYSFLATHKNAAQMGVLTAVLPPANDPDTTDFLSVDLSESGGEVNSISTALADSGYGLVYVDGEFINYANVSLGTDLYQYNLSYLRRGYAGTTIASHAVGSNFALLNSVDYLDPGIFRWPYRPDTVGTTVYFKFTSLNSMIDNEEDLGSVTAYPYRIGGTQFSTGRVASTWQQIQGTNPGVNFYLQPNGARANGSYIYVSIASYGPTGSAEPTWSIRTGITIKDGGITWRCLGLASVVGSDIANNISRLEITAPLLMWGDAANRGNNTSYDIGDLAYAPALSGYIQCVGDGTSDGSLTPATLPLGAIFTDGGVTWEFINAGRVDYGNWWTIGDIYNTINASTDTVLVELRARFAVTAQQGKDRIYLRVKVDGNQVDQVLLSTKVIGSTGTTGEQTVLLYTHHFTGIAAGVREFRLEMSLVNGSGSGNFGLAIDSGTFLVQDILR